MKKSLFAWLLLSAAYIPVYGKLDALSQILMKYVHGFSPDEMREQIEFLDKKISEDASNSAHRFNRALAYYVYYTRNPLHFEPVGQRDFAKDWNIIAFKDLMKAIEVEPDFAEAYWLRGKLWTYFTYEEALKLQIINITVTHEEFYKIREQNELNDYLASLKLNDNFIEAYISLFNFYSDKDEAKAFEYIQTAINRGSDLAAYKRAWHHFNKKEYKEGIIWMSKAIELDPNNVGYHCRRAEFYHAIEDYNSAIDDIMRSVFIMDPNDSNIPRNELKEILNVFVHVGAPPVKYIRIISDTKVEINSGVIGFGDDYHTFEKVDDIWIEVKSKRHHIMY